MILKMVREIAENSEDSIQNNFTNIPLTFIPNKGQVDSRAKYYIKGSGYGFYFTEEEVVMTFVKRKHNGSKETDLALDSSNENDHSNITEQKTGVSMSLKFIDTNPDVKIEGLKKATGKVNYFKGKDQTKWITGLSTYEKIVYRELWSGIDLVFYGMGEQLKYDFIVRPGASLEDIKFVYKGADEIHLDKEGNLLIHNPLGVLIDERPKSYQEIEEKKLDVESYFVLKRQENSESIYGFKIADTYNSNYKLIIDPGLIYSTFLGLIGGLSGDGSVDDIAVDDKGNVYVIGTIEPFVRDFPVTLGAFQEVLLGRGTGVFVTKINSDGTDLVYSTFLDGNSSDSGSSIAVDDKGYAYVTGNTGSSDFPVTLGAYQDENNNESVFVTKINSDGTGLVYSTFLGGSSFDSCKSIAVDDKGNAYVTGQTFSLDFPVTLGAFQQVKKKGFPFRTQSIFVTKINPDGSGLVYSTFLGGSASDIVRGISVDDKGCAYVTGDTRSSDFPVTLGAYQEEKRDSNIFVTKINSDGTGLVYSTFLGSGSPHGIVVDDKGNTYVTGSTASSNFPVTIGAFQEKKMSVIQSVFVTKINSDGTGLVYSTFLGGSSIDSGSSIAIDDKGCAYITGETRSSDFPVTIGAFQKEKKGIITNNFTFVTKLSSDGSRLVYSTFLGEISSDIDASVDESSSSIAVDDKGDAYVSGETPSSKFPVTLGAFQEVYLGGLFTASAFVSKLNTTPIH